MRFATLTLAALTAVAPLTAFADDDPKEAALEARQGYFLMLGANMGTLAGIAKGEIAYDEAAAAQAAANIETLSNYPVGMHFVEGSSSEDMDDSEALPAIWSDMDGFTAKYDAFVEAAAGAGEAVKGGQENVGPVLQKLGGSCKGCHDDFRKKG